MDIELSSSSMHKLFIDWTISPGLQLLRLSRSSSQSSASFWRNPSSRHPEFFITVRGPYNELLLLSSSPLPLGDFRVPQGQAESTESVRMQTIITYNQYSWNSPMLTSITVSTIKFGTFVPAIILGMLQMRQQRVLVNKQFYRLWHWRVYK